MKFTATGDVVAYKYDKRKHRERSLGVDVVSFNRRVAHFSLKLTSFHHRQSHITDVKRIMQCFAFSAVYVLTPAVYRIAILLLLCLLALLLAGWAIVLAERQFPELIARPTKRLNKLPDTIEGLGHCCILLQDSRFQRISKPNPMKKLILLIAIAFIIQGNVSSQSCLPEGITFTRQGQIDSFQINYPGCTEIEGGVSVSGDSIHNLSGLNVLTSIGGECSIQDNDSLVNLTGLDNLASVGGNLLIAFNDALSSIAGLNNLNSIGGKHEIRYNVVLTSLTGLDNLNSIGGRFLFEGNDVLISLTGLGKLTSIGGGCYVQDNGYLTSLTGLDSLTSIGGELWIQLNPILTSLTGLESLDSIVGRTLQIWANSALTSLTGLCNLDYIGGHLTVVDNYRLTTCEVKSICDYLANPNGGIIISSNTIGCNSPQEVRDACMTVGVSSINIEFEYSIYPNPATTELFISTESGVVINEAILYNQMGQVVLHEDRLDGAIDISMLPTGMYVVELVANASRVRTRVMIL
jgi:type IX secretion system substrate protein